MVPVISVSHVWFGPRADSIRGTLEMRRLLASSSLSGVETPGRSSRILPSAILLGQPDLVASRLHKRNDAWERRLDITFGRAYVSNVRGRHLEKVLLALTPRTKDLF